jgi:hypothetical protein
MARGRKDGQGKTVDRTRLYQCFESFSSHQEHGHCAAGTRLRGDHPTVQGWPQFFVDDDTPDDQMRAIRARLWEPAGGIIG